MTLFEYLLVFLLPVIGGAGVLLMPKTRMAQLKLLLTFSGAYLFGISIVHLLPVVYESRLPAVGVYVLLGFLLQLLLDFLSKGVEHGHVHEYQLNRGLVTSIMLGLSVHAFLEGIPLGGLEHQHVHTGHTHHHMPLLLGIAFHKIPAAFALMAILSGGQAKLSLKVICLLLFSLMTPLAAFLTDTLAQGPMSSFTHYLPHVMAIVIGSFMHLSTTILFEIGAKGHSMNVYRLLAILAGFAFALLSSL